MIGGWLALADNRNAPLLNLPLPETQELTLRDLATPFVDTDEETDVPYSVVSIGDFTAELTDGTNDEGEYGYQVRFVRAGVHGTVLLDTLEFDIATILLGVEHCPAEMIVTAEPPCIPLVTFPDS